MQPKQLGPFRIVRVLGRGGMGSVYEAVHLETGEPAAVKVLLTNQGDSEELRERFAVEIDVLKKLRHSNIVRLFGFGEEEDLLYFVMELVSGRTLQQELRQKRLFRWDEVCKIGLDIAQGLKHAHDRGIIHRDIKPANVMLDRQGAVKLSDFGIAHVFGGSRLTNVNSVVGTLEYMSPEQSQGNPIGPKSDLYALGVVLYTLLVGRTPFPARSLPELLKKHQSSSPEPLQSVRRDVPESFEAIILELLSIQPEKRPTNAYLLARRLQSILQAYIGNPETIFVYPISTVPSAPLPVPQNIQESKIASLAEPIASEKSPPQSASVSQSTGNFRSQGDKSEFFNRKSPVPSKISAHSSLAKNSSSPFKEPAIVSNRDVGEQDVNERDVTPTDLPRSLRQEEDFSVDADELFTQTETREVSFAHYQFDKKPAPFGILDIWSEYSPYAQSVSPALQALLLRHNSRTHKRHFTKQIKERADEIRRIEMDRGQTQPGELVAIEEQRSFSSQEERNEGEGGGPYARKRKGVEEVNRTTGKRQNGPASRSSPSHYFWGTPQHSKRFSPQSQPRSTPARSAPVNRFEGEAGLESKIQSGIRPAPSLSSGVFSDVSRTRQLEEQSSPNPKTQKSSRFTRIEERELGHFSPDELLSSRPLISVQTVLTSTALILIAFFVWYMLQPVPADVLYERILTRINNDGETDSWTGLLQSERNIESFLTLYPNDSRRSQMDRYVEELRLYKMQREFERRVNLMSDSKNLQPVERAYLEALTLARLQPELALEKFQAIVELFGSDLQYEQREPVEPDLGSSSHTSKISRPRTVSRNDLCVELARRRWETLQTQITGMIDEQKTLLQKRLDKAVELEETDPQRAAEIRRSIIILYQDKPWAHEIVEQLKNN
ncbi:MAG: serine/threonine protein kinase [Thermoguttaceae bacterium]